MRGYGGEGWRFVDEPYPLTLPSPDGRGFLKIQSVARNAS